MIRYTVEFTRDTASDARDLTEKGLPVTAPALTDLLSSMMTSTTMPGASFQPAGSFERRSSENHVIIGNVTVWPPKIDIQIVGQIKVLNAELERMEKMLGAALSNGTFEITKVHFDGSDVTPEWIRRMHSLSGLKAGADLCDLSSQEVFDRTKRHSGNVVLIAAGVFDEPHAFMVHGKTSYAVGRLDDTGLFSPIESHLTLNDADRLFDKTIGHQPDRRYN